MSNIAQRLMAIGHTPNSADVASSIFGSASSLADSINQITWYRIALYPFISEQSPEIAMGIAACLAYFLEQYSGISIYRVFAKIDENDSSEDIDISDSQFRVDDWELEGLDDNIALWGLFSSADDGFSLEITVDKSFLDIENSEKSFTYKYKLLSDLIKSLPQIAQEIIEYLEIDLKQNTLIVTYNSTPTSDEQLMEILKAIFYWNLDIYLYLWDVDWEDEEITEQFRELVNLCENNCTDFHIWIISMALSQVCQVGLDAIGELLIPFIDDIRQKDKDGLISGIVLSRGLLRLGFIEDATKLVETQISKSKDDYRIWLAAIDLYLQAKLLLKAIEASQRAIEVGIINLEIFQRYARLLIQADSRDIFVEELVFVDPDEIEEDDDELMHEIVISLDKALDIAPNDLNTLYLQLPYLIELDSESLWEKFEMFINLDKSGEYSREIIEVLDVLDDILPASQILEKHLSNSPNNIVSYMNLGALAILDENYLHAKEYLEKAQQLTKDVDVLLEIEHLLLSAQFPDFDRRYGEITTILRANNRVDERDVELIEEALEIAPKFADLYVLLAQAYLSWDDRDSALEVLNDGKDKAGETASLLRLLAVVSWQMNNRETAFTYINKAIQQFPNDVMLLTQIATFLIENNQLNDARPFIERAESINPSHPSLWELRSLIAGKTNK